MNTKNYLKNLYTDFYGIESKDIKREEKTDNDVLMEDYFEKINKLYISDESINLLKNIIEYMRKYHDKIETNYITFNIKLISSDKSLIDNICDILYSFGKKFEYIDNYSKTNISIYDIEKPENVLKLYSDNGLISLYDLDALNMNDTNYIKKFYHNLSESLNGKKITVLCGSKDELNHFFELGDLEFNYVIEDIKPDVQDIYQEVLDEHKNRNLDVVRLLDYITNTYPNSKYSPSEYKAKLSEYISFNNDIPKYKEEKTMDEIFKELNELVGLDDVKKTLYELKDLMSLKNKTKEDLKINDINLHMVFLGNPGTGKTTVARLVAGILYNLKYIKENKLIEVTSKDLVAEYVGQTAPKTNAVIERALGGVLFIDEAYALATGVGDSNSYNAEAIATLIAAMENNRDNLVVIFAGYTKEMQAFLDSNSGIVSRIGYTLNFKDYTDEELIQIFKGMIKKAGFKVNKTAIDKLESVIKEYRNSKNFGNARFVRNVYEKTIVKHASNTKDETDKNKLKTITKEDISVDGLLK